MVMPAIFDKLKSTLRDSGPLSIRGLCELTGCSRSAAKVNVCKMHRTYTVHIVGWERDSRGRNCAPIYSFGFGTDVERPPPKPTTQRVRKPRKVVGEPARVGRRAGPTPATVELRERILAALPATVRDLCDSFGLTDHKVREHLRAMRAQVHVAEWVVGDRGSMIAVYAPGDAEDAPRIGVLPPPDRPLYVGAIAVPDSPYRSKFVGDVHPWTGLDVSQLRNKMNTSSTTEHRS
jgi:hypothetical protein